MTPDTIVLAAVGFLTGMATMAALAAERDSRRARRAARAWRARQQRDSASVIRTVGRDAGSRYRRLRGDDRGGVVLGLLVGGMLLATLPVFALALAAGAVDGPGAVSFVLLVGLWLVARRV